MTPLDPLLVSVRSGAAASMPGMMETILNLGLDDAAVRRSRRTVRGRPLRLGLVSAADPDVRPRRPRRARRSLRVASRRSTSDARGSSTTPPSTPRRCGQWWTTYRDLVREATGQDFPDDPWVQLRGAVEAVFRSWNTKRAIAYRREFHIPDDLGTAVTVQAMVFGNLGDDCATGVAFTRDPATGDAGWSASTSPTRRARMWWPGFGRRFRSTAWPRDRARRGVRRAADAWRRALEAHFADAQDLEFTIERGRLWMLQTRAAKRTGTGRRPDRRRDGERGADRPADGRPARRAGSAGPAAPPHDRPGRRAGGADRGPARLTGRRQRPGSSSTPTRRSSCTRAAGRSILVRRETSPEDFHGMVAARGIVTARGGTTSHAAVVARGMGKPCVTGAGALEVNEVGGFLTVGDTVVRRHDWLTIDGATGRVMQGRVRHGPARDRVRSTASCSPGRTPNGGLRVRANADTPHDAATALRLGAEGIGLCRTEHMFFQGNRIQVDARDDPGRRYRGARRGTRQAAAPAAGRLRRHLPGDGRVARSRSARSTRPLHEFLPHARGRGSEPGLGDGDRRQRRPQRKVQQLREANPMLGFRGCRLGIAYPEITAMQARAIFSAACQVVRGGRRGRCPR